MKLLRGRQLLGWSFSKAVRKWRASEIDIAKTTPSVVLSEEEQVTFDAKPLTPEQKQQLGLMIVKPPFNVRMSLQKQLNYLPSLTTELYAKQMQQLEQKVRILEMPKEGEEVDMLKLTNIVYKDIYARYLIARGFGVQWQGDNSSVGALNPEPVQEISAIYRTYLKAYKEADLYTKKVPTLYSFADQAEVLDEDVSVETINRIGGFFLSELVDFGSYEEHFRPLREKNGQISLMLFSSEFWPTLSTMVPNKHMQAVCIHPAVTYIVLKHEDQEKYLVTSLEHFKNQSRWFERQKYSKHLLVDGKDFAGMKAKSPRGDTIPIIMELQEFDRQYGSRIYPVVPAHILSDYERAQHYRLPLNSIVETNGLIECDVLPGKLDVRQPATESIVKQYFSKIGILVDLNDVCEQEIFLTNKKEQLYLLPLERLFLRVSEKSRNRFLKTIEEKCNIQQSKVEIPKMPRLRGKFRRRFIKKLDKLLEQRTEYYTLEQALRLEEVCISTMASREFPVPVFQKRGELVMPKGCGEQLVALSKNGPVSLSAVEQLIEPTASRKIFYLSRNFIRAALYLSNSASDGLDNVIIEPQSQTEGVLKYALTLAAGINNNNFSLIKLHPTLDQSTRNMSVETMIMGAYKANDQRQYGYGFDSFRLWVAKKDKQKGDRIIHQIDINAETTNANFLRKCYWQLLSYIKHVNPALIPNMTGKQRSSLPFFDRFLLDHCDYFILNMERSYNKMDLCKVHSLTMEFFKDLVTETYLNSVTKRLIAYPKEHLHHLGVFRRLLECLAVVAPMIPFSAMHVSKQSYLRWPKVESPNLEDVEFYNKLITFRIDLRNKLSLNKLQNALVYVQTPIPNVPENELALLLNVRKVLYTLPEYAPTEKFAMKKCQFPCRVYFYDQTCYRCDPKRGNRDHLCINCQEYLRLHPQPQLQQR